MFQHCEVLRTRNVVSNSNVCVLAVVCYVNNGLCHVPQPSTLNIKENINNIYDDLCDSDCS